MHGSCQISLSLTRHLEEPSGTDRVAEVCARFGLSRNSAAVQIAEGLALRLTPGTITLLTGPSGSGKTALLETLASRVPTARAVHRLQFPSDRAVVDAVATDRELSDALSLLTACALGEPRLWIRSFPELSDGEKFRARLARAIGLQLGTSPSAPLLCDEFCAILHRRVAKAIAYNVRKLVTRRKLTLVVATSHDDLAEDLQADRTVVLRGDGAFELADRRSVARSISFRRRLRIERGARQDYEQFAPMHYRDRDELGFVDRVFALREGVGGKALGVVVYAHGPLELSLRNKATANRFRREPKRLKRELRILRRLVMHPDVRGCGLGHWLVRKTLPLVGVRYVECLAAMGAVNPVFEKAGMERIGVCPEPPHRQKTLTRLRAANVEPLAPNFAIHVCRRPSVRRIVAEAVADWYRIHGGDGKRRVAKQSPQFLARTFRQLIASRPVYYLWTRDDAR